MKNLKLLAIFLFLTSTLIAQIDYLIPNAGAPGMSVYVELIAPPNDRGKYGSDGFYINNEGEDLRLEVVGGSSDKMEVSPFVISWNGRLVSAYVYFDVDLTPNSSNYNELRQDFRNRLVLRSETNGTIASDSIYAVLPSTIGDNPNGTIFGQNGLGFISSRNTLVVDSLTLANATYTISQNDPDPNQPGNQAFLPFVLLSKGTIRGTVNTTIDASANGKDGGPGGGGGGGSFCDNFGGTNGGRGFTGGSPGGRNFSTGGGDFEEGGNGSGSNFNNNLDFEGRNHRAGGSSLNGNIGGRTHTITWESSGGGTGHPFGKSAQGYDNNGSSGTGQGEYGAGSGNDGEGRGGHAGYGSDGTPDGSFPGTRNHGLAHGNNYGVPIAGGSGGGGGNPQASFLNPVDCAGEGGGGGGAIRIYAPQIFNITINANGADGENDTPPGGAGSGGYVEVNAKEQATGINYSAEGGAGAGTGRLRNNTFGGSLAASPNATLSRTVATDSAVFVSLNHTVRVNKRRPNNLRYYYKSKDGDWQIVYDDSGVEFPVIDLTFDETISDKWYGASFFNTGELDDDDSDFIYVPEIVLSQAAANLFQLIVPDIDCEEDVQLSKIGCEEAPLVYDLEIRNVGTANLIINDLRNSFTWTPQFTSATVEHPDGPAINDYEISPNSASFVRVSFNLATSIPGPRTFTLALESNDPDENPKEINFTIDIIEEPAYFVDEDGNRIEEELRFRACLDETPFLNETLFIERDSRIQALNYSTSFTTTQIFTYDEANLNSNNPRILLDFPDIGQGIGTYEETVYLKIDNCPNPVDSVKIIVELIEAGFGIVGQINDEFDFGQVRIGSSSRQTIIFENTGSSTFFVAGIEPLLAPFQLISTDPNFPFTLEPAETFSIDVEFTPTVPGVTSQLDVTIFFNNPGNISCQTDYQFDIIGDGIQTNLEFPNQFDFGKHEYCYDWSQEMISVNNLGSDFINLSASHTISGPDAANFRFDGSNPLVNNTRPLPPGATQQIFIGVENEPFTPGIKRAKLIFEIDGDPVLEKLEIDLIAEFLDSMTTNLTPTTWDIGEVPYGIQLQANEISVDVRNTSNTFTLNYNGTLNPDFTNTDPGEEIDVNQATDLFWDWNYLPVEGAINESLTFNMVSNYDNCDYPQILEIVGEGVRQDLDFSSTFIDFGRLLKCEQSLTEEINFWQIGPGNIEVTDIRIADNNPGDFNIINDPATPFLMNSSTITFDIEYDNEGAGLGLNSATIEIDYSRNGFNETKTLVFQAEKYRLLDINPIILDFGDLQNNTIQSLNAQVSKIENIDFNYLPETENGDDNLQTFPVSPIGIEIFPDPDIYEVEFRANTIGLHSSTINIPYQISGFPDCYDTLRLEILANVIPDLSLEIYIPDLTLDPLQEEADIPIYARLLSPPSTYELGLDSLNIALDRTVFFPSEFENGAITGSSYDGDNLLLELNKQNLSINETNTLIGTLKGVPLLGNKKVSLATPSGLKLSPEGILSSVDYVSGNITLTVCEEGGDRLLFSGAPIDLTFRMNNSILEVKAQILEAGHHKVLISDITGKVIEEVDFIRNPGEKREFEFNFPISRYKNGVYFLVLQTPNERMSELFQVVR